MQENQISYDNPDNIIYAIYDRNNRNDSRLRMWSHSKEDLLDAYVKNYMLDHLEGPGFTWNSFCEEYEGVDSHEISEEKRYQIVEDYLNEDYCEIIELKLVQGLTN